MTFRALKLQTHYKGIL